MHSPNPNFLQGSASAALTWVVYDAWLNLDREIIFIWRARWSLSTILYLFSRYHTVLALGFFLMEAIGTKHFTMPLSVSSINGIPPSSSFYAPCIANLKVRTWPLSVASRWYLGLTEVLSILAGELLILLRINTVYGWSRNIIGLATTILSIMGGSKHLMGSTNILTCFPNQVNVPDVNVASIYLGLVIHKRIDVMQVIETTDGQRRIGKLGLVAAFKSSRLTPTLHRCLRDAAVLLVNLLLIVFHNRYAQMGTAWLLATYSVASTRIFLNLKDITLAGQYNDETWSEFQQNSAVEFQLRSELRASEELGLPRRAVRERGPSRAPDGQFVCNPH
ncbi:hypothetical protein DFH06DRAFT_1172979 [Mycena polygramma]|nr:hypothetical protein DFH06DRAFT_1172979 [Mycena polygramma]